MARRPRKNEARCKNCGDITHFGNATGDREHKGWCRPCYEYWKKHCKLVSHTGENVYADDGRTYVGPTNPYNPRSFREDD